MNLLVNHHPTPRPLCVIQPCAFFFFIKKLFCLMSKCENVESANKFKNMMPSCPFLAVVMSVYKVTEGCVRCFPRSWIGSLNLVKMIKKGSFALTISPDYVGWQTIVLAEVQSYSRADNC